MKKYTIAFVCVHNSCRSQMAEAWMKELASDLFDSYSAGTEAYPRVKPKAVQVMEEIGLDMSDHKPKLMDDIPKEVDALITMGCNVTCPYIPCKIREDWGLDDPSGGPVDGFRQTRDLIKDKVLDFIQRTKDGALDQ